MPSSIRLLMLSGFGSLLLASASAQATVADDLCAPAANPCVISTTENITDGSLLDFGNRAVVVTGILDAGEGAMTIQAGSFTIDPSGIVRARGDIAGEVNILTTGDIVVNGTSIGGAINQRGPFEGGVLTLQSTGGSILGSGKINLSSGESGGSGTFDAAVAIDLTGVVDASGGTLDFGGSLFFDSMGPIDLAEVDVQGGESGELQVTAGGAVTFGIIRARATDDAGSGPVAESFFVESGGPFVLEGEIDAISGLDGSGGEFAVTAGPLGNRADVTFLGPVSLRSRGDFGFFGELTAEGAVVTLASTVDVTAGAFGDAGTVDVHATDSLVLTGSIDVGAGMDGNAGEIHLSSDGLLSVQGPLHADAGDSGGLVTLLSGDALEIAAPIRVDAPEINAGIVMAEAGGPLTVMDDILANSSQSDGGVVSLEGCIVTVEPGVVVNTAGSTCSASMVNPACLIVVNARGSMDLAGQFTAGLAGRAELAYRDPTRPPVVTAIFDVLPMLIEDPTLPVCDSDQDGFDDDADNCALVVNEDQLDSDLDGAGDVCDNCTLAANGPLVPDAGGNVQLDEDGDGFGNRCDCDFDGDGFCTIGDFNLFLPDFVAGASSTVGTDMDGDGFVSIGDFNLFLPGFTSGLPGPSAAP